MRQLLGAALLAATLAAPAAAQQRQADLHANYSRGARTHADAWGAGGNLQLTWGAKNAPLRIATSAGLDYTKQDLGPTQTNLSYDTTLQPGGGGSLTPYVGGSAGANWSGGRGKQWNGARLGLEAIAGFQLKLAAMGDLSWKAEERFGYVRGQEHALATRLGVAMSF